MVQGLALAVFVIAGPHRQFAVTEAEGQAAAVIISPRQRQPDLVCPLGVKLLPDLLGKLIDAFQLFRFQNLRLTHALVNDSRRYSRLQAFVDVLETVHNCVFVAN